MLISILANLVQQGGVIPPPTPTPQTGDGFRRDEAYGFNEREAKEKKLKQDNENLAIILSSWIIENNN